MSLLLYLPESKADYFINLYMWYEVDCVLETVKFWQGFKGQMASSILNS